MRKDSKGFVTQTIDCDPQRPAVQPSVQETAFEKGRGISSVEIRRGFAQAHVLDLGDPILDKRIEVLQAIAEADISLDFLKLTHDGLSFLVKQELASRLDEALKAIQVHHTVKPGHDIVLVHAVNMRDEEGLIARVLRQAMVSGVKVEHIGDMHDRMLMVVDASRSDALRSQIESSLLGDY